MPKKQRFKLTFWAYILIFLVICGLATLYLLYYTHSTKQRLTTTYSCRDFSTFTQAIESSFSDGDSFQKTPNPLEGKKLQWVRNYTHPIIVYNGYSGKTYFMDDTSVSKATLPIERTNTELSHLGFSLNSLNTFSQFTGADMQISTAHWGYTKENQLFTIDLRPTDKENQVEIELTCALPNKEYDYIYDQIIEKSPTSSDEVLSIEQIQDRVIILNRNNHYENSGQTEYWGYGEKGWEPLYSGQKGPNCSIFESRRIGRTLYCIDDQSGKDRKVSF